MTDGDGRQLAQYLATMNGRMGSTSFKSVSEELVHQGAVVSFYDLKIADGSGNHHQRDVVRHPGAVSIVPFDGVNVILVRQYRAAIDGDLFEIPAGKRDVSGEPPVDTARRELAEEIGMKAGSIELLANMHHSPGFCDEYGYIFLATDLEAAEQSREGPEEQAMTVHAVPLHDAVAMCFDGRITDSKTLIGILALAVRRLR